MGISNLTGMHLKSIKQSALYGHLLKCNFSIDFDHFGILASDTNKFRLLIKESLLINVISPSPSRKMVYPHPYCQIYGTDGLGA